MVVPVAERPHGLHGEKEDLPEHCPQQPRKRPHHSLTLRRRRQQLLPRQYYCNDYLSPSVFTAASVRSLSLSRPNTLSPQLRSRSARPLSLFASRRFPSFHSEVHNHVRGCVNLASLLKRNLGSRTVCIRVSCGKSERERVLDGRGGKSSLCSVDGIDRGRN